MTDTIRIRIDTIKAVVSAYPAVVPHLTGKALYAAKTYDFFLSTMTNLIESVYEGSLGGEFTNIARNLILGQISQAYEQAWVDDGGDLPPPEYLRDASQASVLAQYEHVDGLYQAIIDARVDKTPLAPLRARAPLWAQRYVEAYNDAKNLIAMQTGGKQKWRLGATEVHCPFCSAFNGLVAYASEWRELGIQPQNAPNPALTGTRHGEKGCEGWRCDCSFEDTDQRRSPKVYDTLLNIVTR
jgi:hypothetical protein